MEIDKYKGGIVFKWLNKEEIYQKYNGKGREQRLQAHIDKLHTDYIATRSGVDVGYDIHGLFGNILDTDEVELLELETIKKHVQNISNKNIDVFKTSISLRGDDAINHNFISKKEWKNLIEEKIPDIAKGFKIPLEDFEWVAAFHNKKNNPHCHLVVWNKNQDMDVKRKPYINFTEIKKAIAKGVYKEELKSMYEIKDVSKELLSSKSKEEINNYKDELKKLYQNEDLLIKVVETEKTQELVNNAIENMNNNERIYIVNKSDPESYTEIYKSQDNKLTFKNIGKHAILYKDNTYLEAVTFLNKFSNLQILKTNEELERHINKIKEEFNLIEDELKEIMPSVFNIPIVTSNVKQENVEQIVNKLAKLEKTTKSFQKGFIYQYQEPESKRILNEISILLINSNVECKKEFSNYIDICVKIDKTLQKINTYKDYEKTKFSAKSEMIKKVGNQILKFIKETKTEEYKRKVEEWKEKKEYWNQKHKEYEQAQGEYQARQEMYEKQLQEINIRNLIQDAYKLISLENVSKHQKFKRVTKTFGDLSKREIKELIKNNKSNNIDWYQEM